MSLVSTLRANAAVLKRSYVDISGLEPDLPPGRTRDVVGHALLRVRQAAEALDEEAAALERYAEEL